MTEEKSYRQILRSSAIVGGASILGILIGLIRTKAVAILLGPSGVGLIGILNNLAGTATTIFSMGSATAGTKQIAEASEVGEAALNSAKKAMVLGGLLLAFLGGVIFWSLRGQLAHRVIGDPGLSNEVGLLAIAVALNVAAASQRAVLNGLRRIGDLALMSIYVSLFSTLIGVVVLWFWKETGIVLFLLLSPILSVAFGHYYLARIPSPAADRICWHDMCSNWIVTARLGFSFMLASVAVMVGQLVVRSLIQSGAGVVSLGHFEAAWMISMTYVGLVMNAMGSDYFPRLSSVIRQSESVVRLVNQQTEIALLIAAPICLALIGFAPWIINLLYSDQFSESSGLLRWHVLGDILKIASWPMTYVVLAAGNGRAFFMIEGLTMVIFSLFVWIGLPIMGIEAAGIGFFVMYAVNLPVVFLAARRCALVRWQPRIGISLGFLLVVAGAIVFLASFSEPLARGAGLVATVSFAGYSLVRISRMTNLVGPMSNLSSALRQCWGRR